jgi:hypothetical protein
MSGFPWRAAVAAGFLLFAHANQAAAQVLRTDLTLANLQALFVTQQQYWALDDEQSATAALNHLHITQLDPSTGSFQGAINSPPVPSLDPPMAVLPVTGKITAMPVSANTAYPYGNYFSITFTWVYSPVATERQVATYAGAMMFTGYDGSGKMHGTIGGTVSNQYNAASAPQFTFGPVPFSGVLTK